jgi:hypothetical protein
MDKETILIDTGNPGKVKNIITYHMGLFKDNTKKLKSYIILIFLIKHFFYREIFGTSDFYENK